MREGMITRHEVLSEHATAASMGPYIMMDSIHNNAPHTSIKTRYSNR